MKRSLLLLSLLVLLTGATATLAQELKIQLFEQTTSPSLAKPLWGEDVCIAASEPLGRPSGAVKSDGTGYVAIPDTDLAVNCCVSAFKTTDYGKTWTYTGGVQPKLVISRVKVVRSGLDSVYTFFEHNGILYCWNIEAHRIRAFDSVNVADWDVAAMRSGALQLFVEHGTSHIIRRYSSTDGGIDWSSAVTVTGDASTPRVYASLAADTLIVNYRNPLSTHPDPLTSPIRSGRYNETSPGVLSVIGFQDVVTDAAVKQQFQSVYCKGRVWLFYSSGPHGSIDLHCVASTDKGATYGSAFAVANKPDFDEYWFDAQDYGTGVDIIWYADSLAPVSNNNTDKLMCRYASYSTPEGFSTPKQVSQFPPSWSPLGYIPSIFEFGSNTGAIWVGADLTDGGKKKVYYDNFRFATPMLNAPNGGETWVTGSTHTIRWTFEGSPDSVALYYSTDGGGTWIVINSAISGSPASYSWTVPSAITTQAKVRITMAHSTWGDESDGQFSIVSGMAPGTWTRTGVGMGPVYSVITDQTSQSLIYAGSNTQGMFKSTNRGSTWVPISTGLTNLSVTAAALSPSYGSIVYCGTTNGIFKSVNFGDSWTAVNTGIVESPIFVQALAVHPTNYNVAYAAIFDGSVTPANGLYKTSNGGTSWTPIFTLPDTNRTFLSIAIDPATPNTVYAGTSWRTSDGPEFYKSTDGGATWAPSSTGLPTEAGGTNGIRALAINPVNPQMILAGLLQNTASGGVYLTTNGGAQWTQVQNGLPTAIGSHARSVLINPGVVTEFYAGFDRAGALEAGVFRSTDLGATWSSINGGELPPTTTVRSLSYLNSYGMLFAGGTLGADTTSQGVFRNGFTVTGTDESQPDVPLTFALLQNYPNPFNPSTTISFDLPRQSMVTLSVYNVLGQHVATLIDGRVMQPGRHAFSFNASPLASGVYYYRVTTDGFVQAKKMLYLR